MACINILPKSFFSSEKGILTFLGMVQSQCLCLVSNKLNRVRCISSCLRGENDKFLSDEKVKQQSWQNYEQTTFTNILCLAICVVSSLSAFKQVATRNILVETKEQRLGGGGRGGVKRYEKSRTRRAVCRIEGKCCAQ